MHSFCNKAQGLAVVLLAGLAWGTMFRADECRSGNSGSTIRLPLIRTMIADIGSTILSSPAVANDTVFIGARDSSVYAFLGQNRLWRFKTHDWVDASPLYRDGKVYAGSRDGLIYILDARTGDSAGAILNGGTQISSPLIKNNLVLFGSGAWSTNMSARHLADGSSAWNFTSSIVYSSPALKDSTLCFGNNSGELIALNVMDGSLRWRVQTGGGVYFSTPAIAGDAVYFSPGDYDLNLYAVSLADGGLIWRSQSANIAAKTIDLSLLRQLLFYRPEAREKMVARMGAAKKLNAIQVDLLRPILSKTGSAHAFVPIGGSATSSPAIGDSCVFVTHMEYGYPNPRFMISAFERNNGRERWSFSEVRSCVQLGFCSSPVLADSVVIFGWGEGKIYAFHANRGTKLWEDSLEGDLLSSPAISNGKLYAATTAGRIYEFQSAATTANPSGFEDGTYCYPNPAKTVSRIQYYLPNSGRVEVRIFDMGHRLVRVFQSGGLPAGTKGTFTWDLLNVANGAYFAVVKVKYDNGLTNRKTLRMGVLQ